MFIFWGTRRSESVVDTVAEYCPVHRGLHEFDVVAVRTKWHLYGIPVGKGRLAGHEIHTSQQCGHVRAVDPAAIASAPAELRYAEQLASDAEWRQRGASHDPAHRASALREAMVQLCTATELKPADHQVNAELKKPALIGFGSAVLLLVLAIVLENKFVGAGFAAALLATFIYLVVRSDVIKARRRKEALTAAARFGIEPLRPSRAELEAAAKWAKGQGYDKAKKLDLEQLAAV